MFTPILLSKSQKLLDPKSPSELNKDFLITTGGDSYFYYIISILENVVYCLEIESLVMAIFYVLANARHQSSIGTLQGLVSLCE